MRSSKGTEAGFKPSRLIQESHTLILQPTIVRSPCCRLVHHLVSAHHRFRGQKTQQAELRKPTEEQTRSRADASEPASRDRVMNVSLVRQGDPNVDVREKK